MSTNTPLDNWLEPLASLETMTNSFIVTIRSEPRKLGGQAVKWHGSVEHTQSREHIYFSDYARLNGFIAARSETPLLPPWHTRLSGRWHRTHLYRFLQPQKYAMPAKRAIEAGL